MMLEDISKDKKGTELAQVPEILRVTISIAPDGEWS